MRSCIFCAGFVWMLLAGAAAGQNVITTIAGIDAVFNGDGKPATDVPIGYINGVATDGAGNVYFTDPIEHLVLRVGKDGILSVVAGNGIAAYSGDGGPANSAAVAATDSPDQYVGLRNLVALGGIAVDKQGNVFFADGTFIRRVATDGTITTVAGGGSQVPGNGGPATQASLGIVTGLVLDAAGNLYFSEGNRVRKMTPAGILSTYAGTGANGFSGDGGPATAARLSEPLGLALDQQGNLYVADGDVTNIASRIRRITPGGIISTVAGGGARLPADGVDPLNLNLSYASGLAVHPAGALYVFGPNAGFLLKISGGTSTLVTNPIPQAFASNLPARNAYVAGQRAYDNSGIALDSAGNLYVADSRDGHLLKIDATGNLTSIAGNGLYGFNGDGGPALGATLQGPTSITQTPDGTIYFLDALNVRVRAIAPDGTIRTVLSVDNFPMLGVLEILNAIVSDPAGNVYVQLSRRVLRIAPNGDIQIVVNQAGMAADSGDGGAATDAGFLGGGGLARDAAGNIYIADSVANRIRKVTTDGKIHNFAGTGVAGITPDGAVALTSPLNTPTALLADSLGGLYFEESPGDAATAVIRYITPDGHLKSIAGNGKGGFSGDGGPAVQAGMMMQRRTGLALDKLGNLFIADGFNSRVRMVGPDGIINTVIGNGVADNAGDGGLAKNASLFTPRGLLFDSNGNLLISDVSANRIREVLAAPPPITLSTVELTFAAQAGGARPPLQRVAILSPVSGLAFSAAKSAGADWLLLGSIGGFTPRALGLRVDPSNLAAGTYHATVTVRCPLGNPAVATIAVTFQVSPGETPKLSLDNTALSFTFPRNPPNAANQTVRVYNTGTGSLQVTTKAFTNTGGNWLSVNPPGGVATAQTPFHLLVTANPAGLDTGTYTGFITVSSPTSGESGRILVTLTISTLDQAMRLSHTALSFTAVAGGGVVPPSGFAVDNIGRGNMNFTVSTRTLSGGAWLSANPKSGTAPGSSGPNPIITVNVNQAGLAPGFYYGLVRVDAPGAANTPQVVTVVMRVLSSDQDPGPVIRPSDIVIAVRQGAPPPGAMTLLVYNVSAKPQTYVSDINTGDAGNRFRFIPENSTLPLSQPARLVLQPIPTGLTPGVYEAELALQFSDGLIRTVPLRTIVTPALPGTPDAPDTPDAPRDASGCAPTQLIPAITTLGQSFGVPAAWPVALESTVRDDCGNTLDAGNVKISFSNGDPALSMQAVQSGVWHATWVSGHNSGPVTLTVTADDPVHNIAGVSEVTGGLGDPSQAPRLNAAVSAASFAASTPLAPGSIVSLFGQDLANGTASAAAIPLDTTLAGATAIMAGVPMPLIFGSNGQINAFVPSGINPNTSHQIVLQRDLTLSVPISVDVAPAEPAIFGYPVPGAPPNQGAIVNAVTYVVAQPGSPVGAGDVVAIFCTGLGAVDHPVPDGAGAPVSPLAATVNTATVTIGGKNAAVFFSGLTPGFVGLYQIDAIVPSGLTPGNQVPVIVSIAGQTSPPATIAVK